MTKRVVHITEEILFDDVTKKEDVEKILKVIAKKWKNNDFSLKVFFNKKITRGNNNFRNRSGTIEFIRAYKLK